MPKGQRAKPKLRPAPKARRGTSLRALGRLLGVSHTAVEKAITSGRLARSVGRDARGRPRILDLQAAASEWKANAAKPPPQAPNGNGSGATSAATTLTEAQIRVSFQREVKLELENLQKRGILIDAAKERRGDFEHARTVRDSMLNIPDRLAAELAAETDARRVHARLDEEIRKALDALADVFLLEDLDPAGGDGDAGK